MIIFCCPRPRIAVRISDEHINTSITSRINHTISYVPGGYEYSVYALIPFGVPVHAEGAGIIPAGIIFGQWPKQGAPCWNMAKARCRVETSTTEAE